MRSRTKLKSASARVLMRVTAAVDTATALEGQGDPPEEPAVGEIYNTSGGRCRQLSYGSGGHKASTGDCQSHQMGLGSTPRERVRARSWAARTSKLDRCQRSTRCQAATSWRRPKNRFCGPNQRRKVTASDRWASGAPCRQASQSTARIHARARPPLTKTQTRSPARPWPSFGRILERCASSPSAPSRTRLSTCRRPRTYSP